MAILEIKKLTKKFGGLIAVNDVSFSVDEGEIHGFIPANGSSISNKLGFEANATATASTRWKPSGNSTAS